MLKGRNSLTTPGSRETITGPPNSGAIYANVGQVLLLLQTLIYFSLEIKVLDCESLLNNGTFAGDRSSTLPIQVSFHNISFASKIFTQNP